MTSPLPICEKRSSKLGVCPMLSVSIIIFAILMILNQTVQGHPMSKVMVPIDSTGSVSYSASIDSIVLVYGRFHLWPFLSWPFWTYPHRDICQHFQDIWH